MNRYWLVILVVLSLVLPTLNAPKLLSAINGNIAGVLSLHENRAEQVEDWFNKTYSLVPENVSAYINEGRWLLQQNRERESVIKLKKAVSLAPENNAARFFLGLSLTESGRIDDALDQFRNIGLEKIDNGSFDILRHYGWLHFKRASESDSSEDWIKAESYYLISRAVSLESWEKWQDLLNFYFEWEGDSEKGLSVLIEAKTIFSEPDLNIRLADYFISTEQFNRALSELDEAFGKEPEKDALYAAACRLFYKQLQPKIEDWYLRARRNLPDSNESLRCLRQLSSKYRNSEPK